MLLLFLCLMMGSVGLVVHDEMLYQLASRLLTTLKFVHRELFEIQSTLAQVFWVNISPNLILGPSAQDARHLVGQGSRTPLRI